MRREKSAGNTLTRRVSSSTSTKSIMNYYEKCVGCQWQDLGGEEDWCYMFKEAPSELPCSQHDKFQPERDAMSAILKEHPSLLKMVAMSVALGVDLE
jgi:hypothetical protein